MNPSDKVRDSLVYLPSYKRQEVLENGMPRDAKAKPTECVAQRWLGVNIFERLHRPVPSPTPTCGTALPKPDPLMRPVEIRVAAPAIKCFFSKHGGTSGASGAVWPAITLTGDKNEWQPSVVKERLIATKGPNGVRVAPQPGTTIGQQLDECGREYQLARAFAANLKPYFGAVTYDKALEHPSEASFKRFLLAIPRADADCVWLKRQFSEQESLRPLVPDLLYAVLNGVLPQLQRMYEAGFVHYDIKPGNIYLTFAKGQWQFEAGDFDRTFALDVGLYPQYQRRHGPNTPYAQSESLGADGDFIHYDLFALGVTCMELALGYNPLAAALFPGRQVNQQPNPDKVWAAHDYFEACRMDCHELPISEWSRRGNFANIYRGWKELRERLAAHEGLLDVLISLMHQQPDERGCMGVADSDPYVQLLEHVAACRPKDEGRALSKKLHELSNASLDEGVTIVTEQMKTLRGMARQQHWELTEQRGQGVRN